jgi:hypothetical protein
MQPDLRLLPCNQDKKPLILEWQHRASSDPTQQSAWAAEFPGCLWGILCGEGFDVVDVDPTGLGWAFEHEDELRTHTQVTRRRGLHLYFQPTPGLRPRTNCPVQGVDVRSSHSIVIDWRREGLPTIERAMLPMPQWLVEAVMKPVSNKQQNPPAPLMAGVEMKQLPRDLYFKARELSASASFHCQRRVCGVLAKLVYETEGNRNDLLFWASCRLAEFVNDGWLTRKSAEELLFSGAMMCGLAQEEARETIGSGFKSAISGAGVGE